LAVVEEEKKLKYLGNEKERETVVEDLDFAYGLMSQTSGTSGPSGPAK
jgi:hypothetical protein